MVVIREKRENVQLIPDKGRNFFFFLHGGFHPFFNKINEGDCLKWLFHSLKFKKDKSIDLTKVVII